jgi:Flp pilus assembly protein TadG
MKPVSMRRTQASRRQSGVAAVELGFMLLPLAILIFGTTELGRAIYTYNTLDKAVRDAARHLSQHGPGDATIQSQAICLAATGLLTCNDSTAKLAPELKFSNVDFCDAQKCAASHSAQAVAGAGSINLVTVSITGYEYKTAISLVIPDLDFNSISVTMRAQL